MRAYAATIQSVDDSVGRLYEALRQTGQLDNTLIVFLGDNGFFLGEHGMIDKRTMHEASIRVPLLVRYPPLARPGTVVEQMVLNVDLAPSILDICGVAAAAEHPRQLVEDARWRATSAGWRTSWFYDYNYEKQFPYTPNVRGVRTDAGSTSTIPTATAAPTATRPSSTT